MKNEIDDEIEVKIKYDNENLEEKLLYLLKKYELEDDIQGLMFKIVDRGIEELLNE